MTVAARINLQNGIPENTNYEHLTYNAESPVDKYILHRKKIIDTFWQQQEEKAAAAATEKAIEKAVEKELQKVLQKLF